MLQGRRDRLLRRRVAASAATGAANGAAEPVVAAAGASRLCDDASVVVAADLLADAVQHNCWWLDRSRLEDAGDTCADFLMADNADDDGVVNPGTFHRCADSPSDAARCSRSGASDAVVRCVYPPSPPPEARR